MVGGKGGDEGSRAGPASHTRPSGSSRGGCDVWGECAPGRPLQRPGQRKPPKQHPAHALSPAASLPPVLSAGPGFILTSLFPLRMGAHTHPCRHPGAQPTLGTGVHCGKPEASPPRAAGCGAPGSPPGSWADSEGKRQGFWAGAAGGLWSAWKTCFKLR